MLLAEYDTLKKTAYDDCNQTSLACDVKMKARLVTCMTQEAQQQPNQAFMNVQCSFFLHKNDRSCHNFCFLRDDEISVETRNVRMEWNWLADR